jgi:group I intron endonuclease
MFGIVYRVTNQANGKIYIGLTTKSMELRRSKHYSEARLGSNKYFHKAIRKYGEHSFLWVTIDDSNDIKILKNKEKEWITYYESNNMKYGYNLTSGGDGVTNYIFSEEVKQKMSNSQLDYFSILENRNKLAVAHNQKPFYVFDRYGTFIEEAINGSFIAEKYGVSQKAVALCLLGKNNRFAKHYTIIYKEVFSEELLREKLRKMTFKGCEIVMKDYDDSMIGLFNSTIAITEQFGIHKNYIKECLKGERDNYKGYKFELEYKKIE